MLGRESARHEHVWHQATWGTLQIVGQPKHQPEAAEACEALRLEWVVAVRGSLAVRQDPNPKLPTGNFELLMEEVQVLNRVTAKLPFTAVDDFVQKEETRLRHRVLDIRYCTSGLMRVSK